MVVVFLISDPLIVLVSLSIKKKGRCTKLPNIYSAGWKAQKNHTASPILFNDTSFFSCGSYQYCFQHECEYQRRILAHQATKCYRHNPTFKGTARKVTHIIFQRHRHLFSAITFFSRVLFVLECQEGYWDAPGYQVLPKTTYTKRQDSQGN